MIHPARDVPVVWASVTIYRLLLFAYPTKFRQEYGPHMLQVFRDCSIRAHRLSGSPGLLSLWTITLFDLFSSLVEEHLHRETEMTKAKFIRLSGWALMLASVVLIGGFAIGGGQTNWEDPLGGSEALYEYAQLVLIPSSLILYTVGMIGLRIRYGGPSSRLGNTSLLVAAIGGAVGVLGAILEFAFIEPVAWVGSWGWMNLMLSGMVVMLVGYSLFGVSAIRTRPLPRWNFLPLLTAIWFPLVFVIRTIVELTGGEPAVSENYLAFVAMLFLLAGSIALGYILQNDIPAESQGELEAA